MSKQDPQEAGCYGAIIMRNGLPCIRYGRRPMPARKRWLIVSGLFAFTKILGMDPQEAEKMCIDATAATKNKTLHSYYHQ
jgi:hypothetical protein